ncbi:hypothetical protein [Pseudoalteromonas sp. R3]|uniref:hypothetical protein n=1 Tax=Pseudoalteromonas sp. R3 TaxID=1709477 RepID=UPI0006B567E9|nr:hypothetical protein [Pseudoalteromonas sp. R3]AZZ98756.1 hypothetical protein ELR70_17620 [Pseudoalteromonas sp. R3]
MSQIEDLTAELAELSLELGREVEPEKSEAKLKEQIQRLKAEIADGAGDTSTEETDGKARLVSVVSEHPGKLVFQVTSDNDSKFTVLPGKNELTQAQADLALTFSAIKQHETA